MNIESITSIQEPRTLAPSNGAQAATLLKKFVAREDRVGQAAKPISIEVSGKDEILERLEKHLSGDLRLGLYNLLPDGSIRWAVVEFENHGDAANQDTWLDEALKYQRKLEQLSIPSVLERSKRPNGQCYHLHLCFDKALKAKDVREGLRGIGRELFGTFSNEIFPKSADGLGNFIWMPLFGGTDEWGHGIKEGRTVFIGADGCQLEDQNGILANWQFADSRHFLNTIKPLLTAVSAIAGPAKNSTGIELNQPGLDKMEANCPIVKKWVKDPSGWEYDHWLGLGSNYVPFKGGWDRFVELSRKDTANFEQHEIDRIREEVLAFRGPQTYEKFKDQGLAFELPAQAPKAPAGWPGFLKTAAANDLLANGQKYLHYDQDLIMEVNDMWVRTRLERIQQDGTLAQGFVHVECPYCQNRNAVLSQDAFHFVSMKCDRCNQTYHQYPLYPGMFTYQGDLLRVEMLNHEFISAEFLNKDNFRTDGEYQFARRVILNDPQRRFLSDNFQIRRIGDVTYEELGYHFLIQENAVQFQYPALPVNVQDNAFIDRWLDTMFGPYSDFIKDWMAMYGYTNYVSLPVIILTGERSCGKNTFAQAVGKIFKGLYGLWDGDIGQFNEHYKKKLLFVDENPNSDKQMQYTEIKKITGNERIKINEKFQPEYYVPNNLKIIIATNDPRPIFLKWQEEPKSEQVNNFFIYRCPDVPEEKLDNRLGQQLEDRMGYYVRTALKERYERLKVHLDHRNRYALPAPITPLARDLFTSSKTSVELEAEELAEYIVCGAGIYGLPARNGTTVYHRPVEWQGNFYVQHKKIRELVNVLGFRASSNIKAYIDALIRQGVISIRSDYRSNQQHLGYKILRPESFYKPAATTSQTLSGVETIEGDESDEIGF